MRFWFSGEVESDVGESSRLASNDVEDALNEAMKGATYGAVQEWNTIQIIMSPKFLVATGYEEIKRYYRKKHEPEFRLKVDHAAFKAADDLGKRRLIFGIVLRSIEEARKLSICDFDLDGFERDVRKVGEEHGWLDQTTG